MKRNQSGFSTIEMLLIVIVILIIGVAGWKIYDANKESKSDTNTTTVVTTKDHTDTTGTFSFKYPSNWAVSKYVWEPCCEGPIKTEPDWTKVPQPIELKPDGAHQAVKISITADNGGAVTIEKELEDGIKDRFNAYTQIKVNGYNALYHTVDFVGPAEVEAYTDHYYTIVKDKNSVKMHFREKYRHNWNNEYNYDASSFLPDFESIVNSIQFLK